MSDSDETLSAYVEGTLPEAEAASIETRAADDAALAARIAAYELAFRMQTAAPDLVDLGGETADTLRLYGIDRKETKAAFA